MSYYQTSGPLCHFGTLSGQRYQIGLFKNAKIKSKKIGFGDFCEKPHLVEPKSLTSGFWRFSVIFGQKLLKNAKNQKTAILVLPDVDFHKNGQIFTI